MSDLVNADPADIRKLAAALESYRRQVTEAGSSARKALDAAHWHDRQKQAFEARYRDLQRHLDSFMSTEVATMVRTLNELARKLDDIKRMRM
jgi:hypothetical protein